MGKLCCFIFLAFVYQFANSQCEYRISNRAADSISKNAFGKMATGIADQISLSNNISFVPADGKFTMSGNYFFQTTKKDTTKKRRNESFAVGFNATGSITGGTVATLFEAGELNTGVDLGFKFSWRINNPNIGLVCSEKIQMIEKREALLVERNFKIDSAIYSLSLILTKLNRNKYALAESKLKLAKSIEDSVRIVASTTICMTDTCLLRYTDSLLKARSNIFIEREKLISLGIEDINLTEIHDVSQINPTTKLIDRTPRQIELSKKYGLSRFNISYQDTVLNKIRKEYEDKIYEIEMAMPIAGMRIHWLTAIMGWNRVAYRTYYDSLQFSSALQKLKTEGLTLGLQANFYTFYKPIRKASLFSVLLLYKKTNNLEDLTTSKLTQETVKTNGTSERKLSSNYTVYTDPIELYNTVQLSLNYYRFFSKDLKFGWHAFSSADWRSTKLNLYDIGAGFIFGFNSTGAKRLFNIELFTLYKDITRELVDKDKTGWKQLQLGLSIAIPFMIYKN